MGFNSGFKGLTRSLINAINHDATAVSLVYIHTHMDHTLLTDAPDRSVFYVCAFFTANSYMFIYSYVT